MSAGDSTTAPETARISVAVRVAQRALAVVAIAAAAAWLWLAGAAAVAFAFRYPAFDQFRLYRTYLGLPFPDNAIQLENGHRPILPALVRLAEIRWFDANQQLQIFVGFALVIGVFCALVAVIAKERGLSVAQRAAALLACALALFWLGNARILMHGNELVQVYPVVLASVFIPLLVYDASRSRSVVYVFAATASAAGATFSFGAGFACFFELIVALLLVRASWKRIAIPLIILSGVALLYFALPGDVVGAAGAPRDSAQRFTVFLQSLASPWMNAWLAVGTPSVSASFADMLSMSRLGTPLLHSARAIATPFGESWLVRESTLIGGLGALAWIGLLAHGFRLGRRLTRVRFVALSLCTFGLGVSALLAFARARNYELAPDQVFADRYLPWTCLFWLGVALYVGCGDAGKPRRGLVFAILAVGCAALALPTHRAFERWSAVVHRNVQRSAVAADLRLWDSTAFPNSVDAKRGDVLASLDLLRERRLSMYAESTYSAFLDPRPVAPAAPLGAAQAIAARAYEDSEGRRYVAFSGWLADATPFADAILVAVDARRARRGLAKFSHFHDSDKAFLSLARKNGFDGYILDPQEDESFSVVLVDPSSGSALAEIPIEGLPPR